MLVQIVRPERIVFEQVTGPRFQITIASSAECDKVRTLGVKANERNFHRLEAELAKMLIQRHGDPWAEIQVGTSLVLGLHPKSDKAPPPGTSGAVSIGLTIDEPIDDVVARRRAKGVRFRGPLVRDGQSGAARPGGPAHAEAPCVS